MRKLTTTAYALLGLLSLRPTSTYELAKRMRWSNLRAIWPRAESQVYKAPKKLVNEGLAGAEVEYVGDRKRTVYHITEAGREALRAWLESPSDRFRYRSEALVKVSFAHMTSLDALRELIREVRSEALDDARQIRDVAARHFDRSSPAPEREHVNALADAFILEIVEARLRWARQIDEIVAAWEGSAADARTKADSDALWREFLERTTTLIEEEEAAHGVRPEVGARINPV